MRDGLAERLIALALRLDRLRPLNHDPEAYFVERDDIRRALIREAEALSRSNAAQGSRGKFETGTLRIDGRTVRAERRGARAAGNIKKVSG